MKRDQLLQLIADGILDAETALTEILVDFLDIDQANAVADAVLADAGFQDEDEV